jgi:hypothetical protein
MTDPLFSIDYTRVKQFLLGTNFTEIMLFQNVIESVLTFYNFCCDKFTRYSE